MAAYWDGDLVRLRGIERGDAAAHHRFNLDRDYGLLDRVYPPSGIARVEEWIEARLRDDPAAHEQHFQIEAIGNGELVGSIATHRCDPRVGTFGYGLNVLAEHRGRGYAREAICLLLRYYFQELRYQKVNVEVFDINTASKHLHEGLGFQLEGRQRRSVFTGGHHTDLLLYGLTVEEFRELHPRWWRQP